METKRNGTYEWLVPGTVANLVNYMSGGVIWYGAAIAKTGWIGVVVSVPAAMLSFASSMLLIDLLAKYPNAKSYGDLCVHVFGSSTSPARMQTIRNVMDLCLNVELFLYTCLGIIVLGSSLHRLVLSFVPLWAAILIGLAATSPTMFVRDLSALSKLSVFGISAMVANILLLWIEGCSGLGQRSLTHPQATVFVTDPLQLTSGLGIFILAYSTQSLLPSATYAMRKSFATDGKSTEAIHQTLFICVLFEMIFTWLLYSSTGMVVYLLYGSETSDILQLNFTYHIFLVIGSAWMILGYYCKIAVCLIPVAQTLDSYFMNTDETPSTKSIPTVVDSLGYAGSEATASDSGPEFQRDESVLNEAPNDLEALSPTSTQSRESESYEKSTGGESNLQLKRTLLGNELNRKYWFQLKLSSTGSTGSTWFLIRLFLVFAAGLVSCLCPSVTSLLSIAGTVVAVITMFIIPAILFSSDRGWLTIRPTSLRASVDVIAASSGNGGKLRKAFICIVMPLVLAVALASTALTIAAL